MRKLDKPFRDKEIFDNLAFFFNSLDLSFESLVDLDPHIFLDPDPKHCILKGSKIPLPFSSDESEASSSGDGRGRGRGVDRSDSNGGRTPSLGRGRGWGSGGGTKHV